VSDNLQIQLRELIAEQMGLHFPPSRWDDFQRGLEGAIGEFGFADLAAGAEWLLSAPLTKTQVDVLASHLTIGETYFFREKKTFEVLAEKILPELVQLRRKRDRRLRIWSAGCCTGEEPYSLAILLQQVIPDLADWFVTILATDINGRFLQKAAAGVYGEWSFRDNAVWFKDRYFKRSENGRYTILPEIKKRVTFAQLNLAQDSFPSLVAETNAMDLILCRNVLMYFSPQQARRVVQKFRRALVHDGWLVVSPSEASQTLFFDFATVNFPGVILYQKPRVASENVRSWSPSQLNERPSVAGAGFEVLVPEVPIPARVSATPESVPSLEALAKSYAQPDPGGIAESLYESGQYTETTDLLLSSPDTHATTELLSILTRALANEGKLADALEWCDRWVNADKLDPSGHYVRAMIMQELGDSEQSRRSLQAAVYLDPRFVIAHFGLGNLARSCGKKVEASKHFANASSLLGDCQPGEVLPEADGLTADRLTEIITSITAMEAVS
jgi:chemotaxis protein methyltransferase CheR